MNSNRTLDANIVLDMPRWIVAIGVNAINIRTGHKFTKIGYDQHPYWTVRALTKYKKFAAAAQSHAQNAILSTLASVWTKRSACRVLMMAQLTRDARVVQEKMDSMADRVRHAVEIFIKTNSVVLDAYRVNMENTQT